MTVHAARYGFTARHQLAGRYSFIRFFPSQKDAQDSVTAFGGRWVFVKKFQAERMSFWKMTSIGGGTCGGMPGMAVFWRVFVLERMGVEWERMVEEEPGISYQESGKGWMCALL